MKEKPLPKGVKINSKLGEKVFSGVQFDIYQWDQKIFDGTTERYEIIKRRDTVTIIPVIGEETFIVKETQPHWGGEGLCAISGAVEEGETLEEAARRELREETGMVFEHFYLVGVEQIGFVEWFRYVFVATGYKETKDKKLDPGEKSEVVKVSFNELIRLAKTKSFFYPIRFVEDFIIQDKIADLYDILQNPEKHILQ